jgi:hypothetical protein
MERGGIPCVPSPELAGHACGPRARARRKFRPRIIETLALARAWQAMLDSGEARNASQIARDLSITSARVSQVMGLLNLAPAILDHIDDLEGDEGCLYLTERKLRRIAMLPDPADQLARFEELLGTRLVPRPPRTRRGAPEESTAIVG